MLVAEPRALFKKLTPTCTRALETAAGACVTGQHYEVTVEHLLGALLDDRESDVDDRARPLPGRSRGACARRFSGTSATSGAATPASPCSRQLLARADAGRVGLRPRPSRAKRRFGPARCWRASSSRRTGICRSSSRRSRRSRATSCGRTSARSRPGAPRRRASPRRRRPAALRRRARRARSSADPDGPLARFTTDITQKAKDGHIDPIFGREREIRQIIDILARRRKNNPIIVGDAGVGKTALVEGLALPHRRRTRCRRSCKDVEHPRPRPGPAPGRRGREGRVREPHEAASSPR